MDYSIRLTEEFLYEINEICNYIFYYLDAPIAANKLRKKVINNILLLEKSPAMFEQIEKLDKSKNNKESIQNDSLLFFDFWF